MCEVLDRIENKGREEGRMEEKKKTAIRLQKQGADTDFIAKIVETSVGQVKNWLSLANA